MLDIKCLVISLRHNNIIICFWFWFLVVVFFFFLCKVSFIRFLHWICIDVDSSQILHLAWPVLSCFSVFCEDPCVTLAIASGSLLFSKFCFVRPPRWFIHLLSVETSQEHKEYRTRAPVHCLPLVSNAAQKRDGIFLKIWTMKRKNLCCGRSMCACFDVGAHTLSLDVSPLHVNFQHNSKSYSLSRALLMFVFSTVESVDSEHITFSTVLSDSANAAGSRLADCHTGQSNICVKVS